MLSRVDHPGRFGDLDSRELISALDNLGVSHSEGAQTAHTTLSAATLGRNLVAALGLFADVVRRPRLIDDEVEPIRALAIQGLQGIEDDPGTKVVFELRRRHYPDPWGRPAVGSIEGVESASPDDLRTFHDATYRPNGAILAVAGAIDWDEPVPRAVFRPLATGSRSPTRRSSSAPPGRGATTSSRRRSRPRSHWRIRASRSTTRITTSPAPRRRSSAATPRPASSPRSARSGASVTRFTPATRAMCDRAAVVGYAGTSTDRAQETLDVTLAEIARLADTGVEAEELETMRAGLKSSLIMQQESSMGRSNSLASDWYHLGRVRPLAEVSAALDALTPESVSDFAARQDVRDLTLLTLGPAPLRLPPE